MASESSEKKHSGSRIPDFYRLSVQERVRAIEERGLISRADAAALRNGEHTLRPTHADRMIENVIGVLGLPLGLGLNFLINGRDYVIPLVVEEPSIVAALSSAAKTARLGGGFFAEATDPILIGQVQIVAPADPEAAVAAVLAHREEIINLANSLHPKMLARGGGARDIEVHRHTAPTDGREMVVVHLLVDTRDAMGANLVNTMCEGVASLLESITGGQVYLRILSNLTDRALARAEMTVPLANLAGKGYSGEQVRDGIILANDFARVDPYRATTHNKGIMNGVDAVALATGNDWRAIEAAAHAYASRDGRYTSLTEWFANDRGDLVGRIELPMKVGTVGGPLQSNATVAMNHRILGVSSAQELAGIMAAVGLGQNFSALRALATDGIQQGHMTLHARTVANAAGAPPELFETLVERLIESGEIKIWRAQEILNELLQEATGEVRGLGGGIAATRSGHGADADHSSEPRACAHGKIILLGEHAVVYGSHAIAAPVPLAVEARVMDGPEGVRLMIPRWGLEQRLKPSDEGFARVLGSIIDDLGLGGRSMTIEVFPKVPRAMGLGASSALAVAVMRALDQHYRLGLDDEAVNRLAFLCEQAAHGTPSGIDNTLATYGRMMLYQRGDAGPRFQPLDAAVPLRMVVGISGQESLTARTVAGVRRAWEGAPERYQRMFDEIDRLTLEGMHAITEGDSRALGELMNLCHGILNGLQLSTPALEELIGIARSHGAIGAKLTGGGGGGSMIALCPDDDPAVGRNVQDAMRNAGYEALEVTIG
jgi:hydroxymethylglutaryl-CoA reductase